MEIYVNIIWMPTPPHPTGHWTFTKTRNAIYWMGRTAQVWAHSSPKTMSSTYSMGTPAGECLPYLSIKAIFNTILNPTTTQPTDPFTPHIRARRVWRVSPPGVSYCRPICSPHPRKTRPTGASVRPLRTRICATVSSTWARVSRAHPSPTPSPISCTPALRSRPTWRACVPTPTNTRPFSMSNR